MQIGNQIIVELKNKGLYFFYDEYCYLLARKKVAKKYNKIKEKQQLGSLDGNQYFSQLKKLKSYLSRIELRYAHVVSYQYM